MNHPDRIPPTLLTIAGHPRSGTTALTWLMNSHPDINLTFELENFAALDLSAWSHWRLIRKTWSAFTLIPAGETFDFRQQASSAFLRDYKSALRRRWNQKINAETIRDMLHEIYPDAKVVGDKWPIYMNNLEQLIEIKNHISVVIYRDVREVAQSALRQVREGDWKDRPFAPAYESAEKIAQQWVRTIDKMERFGEAIHTVCYEKLVANPQMVMKELSQRLEVDPAGFAYGVIEKTNTEKYKAYLTPHELKSVIDIAGPTMEKLGYEI